MLKCEFCNTELKSVSSLNSHKKTAKYCLEKQGIQTIKSTTRSAAEIVMFDCVYCKKILSTRQNLNIHLNSCVEKFKQQEEELKKLQLEVIELRLQNKIYKELSTNTQECIQSIAKQPKNQTNLFLSPIDLSQEHISKVIQEKFTTEHFYDGQAGVARFAVDNILKDKDGKLGYICTDPARQIFKHITSDGEVKKDVRASKLTKKIAKDVKKVSGEIVLKRMEETNESTEFKKFDKDVCLDFLTKKMDEIAVIDDDSSKFRAELANLTVEK